jgi:hypothetical protein
MYIVQKNWSLIATLLYVEYITYWNCPKLLVCSYVSEFRSLVIGSAQDTCRSMIAKVQNVVRAEWIVNISSKEHIDARIRSSRSLRKIRKNIKFEGIFHKLYKFGIVIISDVNSVLLVRSMLRTWWAYRAVWSWQPSCLRCCQNCNELDMDFRKDKFFSVQDSRYILSSFIILVMCSPSPTHLKVAYNPTLTLSRSIIAM